MLRVAPLLTPRNDVSFTDLRARIDDYEDEMQNRARKAVADSSRACLHAHQLDLIDEESPLVARRLQQARARV